MEKLTFEQLPEAVIQLFNKLEKIEKLLTEKRSEKQLEDDEPLTIKQTADILNLTPQTIYGLVHKCAIPVCKRGKRLYFSKQELLAWIKEGRKKTNSEIEIEADNFLKGKGERK